MPASYINYLLQNNGGTITPYVNVYAQFTSNSTGTSYWSTNQTDSNGMFTLINIPADNYTVYVSNASGVQGTSMGNTNWVISDAAGIAGTYNVLDYGAKGDVVADDTVAIQAALTAAGNVLTSGGGNNANGTTVYMPPWLYKITAPLTMSKDSVTLRGSGLHSTVITLPTVGFSGSA